LSQFDVAIIGTSPACIFEMASRKALGEKTLIIDRNRDIGGSWGTMDHPILGIVESGAHYLPPINGVYELFRDFLGISLDPVYAPKYFMPRYVFGRNHTSWLNRWGGGVSNFDPDFPKTVRSWRNRVSPYYRMILEAIGRTGPKRVPMKYFHMGTIGLVEYLAKFVEKHGLEMMMETSVKKIEIDTSSGIVRITTDQDTVDAKKFILTSCAVLDSVYVDGIEHSVSPRLNPLVQLHLTFKGPPIDALSFGQYTISDCLKLTGNATPFLGQDLIEQGYSLITNLVDKNLPETEQSVEMVIAEHRKHGVLDKRHEFVDAIWHRYEVCQRQDDELLEIKTALAPYIDVLPTHSFGASMSDNAARWRKSLDG
jgi:hypothetical protein